MRIHTYVVCVYIFISRENESYMQITPNAVKVSTLDLTIRFYFIHNPYLYRSLLNLLLLIFIYYVFIFYPPIEFFTPAFELTSGGSAACSSFSLSVFSILFARASIALKICTVLICLYILIL